MVQVYAEDSITRWLFQPMFSVVAASSTEQSGVLLDYNGLECRLTCVAPAQDLESTNRSWRVSDVEILCGKVICEL